MPAKKKTRKQIKQEDEDLRLATEANRVYEIEQQEKEEKLKAKEEADRLALLKHEADQHEESVRLEAMRKADRAFLLARSRALDVLDLKVKTLDEWERFTACVPLPDVSRESDLNTYKSTWLEDGEEKEPHLMMQPMVDACATTEKVLDLLTAMVGEVHEKWNLEQIKWYENYASDLRDKTFAKLDKITTKYLQCADEYENKESAELEKVAIMSYGKDDVRYGIFAHTASEPRAKAVDFSNIDFHIALPSTLHRRRTAIRLIYTAFDHLSNMNKNDKKKKKIKTLYPWPHLLDEDNKDNNNNNNNNNVHFTSIGGIVNMEQLHLPLQPKTAGVNSWLMREITDVSKEVIPNPYPEKGTQGDVALPFYVSYTIPSYVILNDNDRPLYGVWDDETREWKQDGAQTSEYDEKTRQVTVQVSVTKPFSIIQPRTLDFPYRSWHMKPVSRTVIHITLQGSRCDVLFEITPGKLSLLEPSYPVLMECGLHKTPMHPGILLSRLRRCGLNLMPSDDDAIFARKPLKQAGLEPFLHGQVGTCCHLFEFKGSLFNSSRNVQNAMYQVRLETEFDNELLDILSDKKLMNLVSDDSEVIAQRQKILEEQMREEEEEEAKRKAEEDAAKNISSDFEDSIANENDIKEDNNDNNDNDNNDISSLSSQIIIPEIGQFNDWVNIHACEEKCFVVAVNERGPISEEPLDGRMSHVSLRRCVVEHYSPYSQKGTNPRLNYDLAEVLANVDRADDTLHLQETVRRTMNLLRPFTFH